MGFLEGLASILPGVGGIFSAKSQSDAIEDAARAQQEAARYAADIQRYMYDTSRSDFTPYMQMGTDALAQLGGYTPQIQYNAAPSQPYGTGMMTPGSLTGGSTYTAPTLGNLQGTQWDPSQSKPGGLSIIDGAYYQGGVPIGYNTAMRPAGQSYDEFVTGPQGRYTPSQLAPSNAALSYTGQPAGQGQQQTMGYQKTGPGIDPTGGASTYIGVLGGVNPTLQVDPTGGAGKWQQSLAGLDPTITTDSTGGAGGYMGQYGGLDITGGAQKYADALENLKFEMDPTDPIYQWRKEQTEKSINQAAAARGMYNSRPTINALGDANMALQEGEIARQFAQNYLPKREDLSSLYGMAMGMGGARGGQLENLFGMGMDIGGRQYGQDVDNYNRQYGQLADQYQMSRDLGSVLYGKSADDYARRQSKIMDAYNMAFQSGQANYNKLLDLVKAGQGAAGAMGTLGANTGQGLASTYSNLGTNLGQLDIMGGDNSARLWQGLSDMPMNYLLLNKILSNNSSVPGSSSLDQYFNF